MKTDVGPRPGPGTEGPGAGPNSPAVSWVVELGRHAPAFVIVVVGLVLSLQDGGYASTDWYPAALFALALACVSLLAGLRTAVVPRGSYGVAVWALGAFTVWNYVSIVWAAVPSDAWDGANRSLLYWLAFAIVGLRAWSVEAITAMLVLLTAGVTAIAGSAVLSAVLGELSPTLFVGGRLSDPTGYANATAALFLIALWPALHLATSPRLAWPIRSVAAGAAALLLQTAVLTQSRGAAIALVVAAIAFVVVTPRRWSSLLALAGVIGATSVGWDALTAIRLSEDQASLAVNARTAGIQILLHSAAVMLGSAIVIGASRLLWRGRGASRGVTHLGNAVLLVIALAGGVSATTMLAANGDWLGDRWDDFKQAGYDQVESDETRFGGSLGSGRYDFYRVSLQEFRDRPLLGIGSENFAVPYLQERRTLEAPMHPHSLALRIPAQLGLPGVLLFVVFLAALGWSCASARRGLTRDGRAAQAAAFTGGFLWLVHAQGDWLWAMPSVTILGVALFSLAARPARETGVRGSEENLLIGSATSTLAWRIVVVCVLLAGVAALGLPWLAARYDAAGRQALGTNPDVAFSNLGRAARLNPLTADPHVVRGLIASRLGERAIARRELRAALSREPENWFAHLELGLLQAAAGDRSAAGVHLAAAQRLNPRQPAIRRVRRRVEAGRSIDVAGLEQELFDQIEVKVAPTG